MILLLIIYWTYPIWKSAVLQSAAAAAAVDPSPHSGLRCKTSVVGWSDTDWRETWQRQLTTCVPWWTDNLPHTGEVCFSHLQSPMRNTETGSTVTDKYSRTASWSNLLPQLRRSLSWIRTYKKKAVVLMSTQHRDDSVVAESQKSLPTTTTQRVELTNWFVRIRANLRQLNGSWRSFSIWWRRTHWCCELRWIQTGT